MRTFKIIGMVAEGYRNVEGDLFIREHDFQVVKGRERYPRVLAVFNKSSSGDMDGKFGTSPQYYLFQVDEMLTDEKLAIVQCFLKKRDLRGEGINILERFYVWYEGAWYEKHVAVVKSYTDCYVAFAEFQEVAARVRSEGLTWDDVEKAFPKKVEEEPQVVAPPEAPKEDRGVRKWLSKFLGV